MITAIILASGIGKRFSGDQPKQFIKLAGVPIIVHTLKVFEGSRSIDDIIIVTNRGNIELVWEYAKKYDLSKISKIVAGGKTRQESSFIGLSCCDRDTCYVLIHDAVRPFITNKIIKDVSDAVFEYKAVNTAISSTDTIIKVNRKNFIDDIPDRSFLKRCQTPQAFEYNMIRKAHDYALKNNITNASDDCYLVLRSGYPVYVVNGDEQNIKITYPIDMHIADKLFQLKMQSAGRIDYSDILKDKVVAVIGGHGDIGRCVVEKLKKTKAIDVFLSRNTEITINVTSLSSIKNAFNKIINTYGTIDMVVNCAGDLIRKDVMFMTENEWDYIYNVNIKGSFLIAKAILPVFKKKGKSSIVFVGSSSYTRGRPGYAAYSSSKAALVNFVQALAEETTEFNINVNVVSPGMVATPLRYGNFEKEDPNILINPETVAEKIVSILAQDITGNVFEVRSNHNNR